MKFSEIRPKNNTDISEALDNPYPIKMNYGSEFARGKVKLPDSTDLVVQMHKTDAKLLGKQVDGKPKYVLDPPKWEVVFVRGGTDEVTAQGDAQRIFATVATAVQDFIETVKPGKVFFSAKVADGRGREALYKRLSGMLAKKYGYTFTSEEDPRRKSEKLFVLTRQGTYN